MAPFWVRNLPLGFADARPETIENPQRNNNVGTCQGNKNYPQSKFQFDIATLTHAGTHQDQQCGKGRGIIFGIGFIRKHVLRKPQRRQEYQHNQKMILGYHGESVTKQQCNYVFTCFKKDQADGFRCTLPVLHFSTASKSPSLCG